MSDSREYVTFSDEKGTINVSPEVIAAIAASAVLEVEGVESLPSTIGKDITEFLGGKKDIARGVEITQEDGDITADVCIRLKKNGTLKETATAVQEKTAQAIESVTGLSCKAVNVHICGIELDK